MSNPAHLAKLLQGAEAWNKWRSDHPEIVPDLCSVALTEPSGVSDETPSEGLDLGTAQLDEIDVSAAGPTAVNLTRADLKNANLRETDLSGANLALADLSDADLTGARFQNADLSGAILTGADLCGADLSTAVGLTTEQVATAQIDAETSLPAYLKWQSASESEASAQAGPEETAPPTIELERPEISPYAMLKIGPEANALQIRTAYLRLAKKYHPDVNPGDPDSEQRFKDLNDAYRLAAAASRMQQRPNQLKQVRIWVAAAALFALGLSSTLLMRYLLEDPSPYATVAQNASTPARHVEPDQNPAPPTPSVEIATAADKEEITTGSTPHITLSTSVAEDAGGAETDTESAEPVAAAISVEPNENLTPTNSSFPGLSKSAEVAVSNAEAALGSAANRDIAEQEAIGAKALPAADSSNDRQQHAALPKPVAEPADSTPKAWEKEWQELQHSGDLKALHEFIERYPDKEETKEARGAFEAAVAGSLDTRTLRNLALSVRGDSPEARLINRRLAKLLEQENLEADIEAWLNAKEADSLAGYRTYLISYPEGRYAKNARESIGALEKEIIDKKDDAAWASAKSQGSVNALTAYLRDFPKGRHLSEARKMRAAINRRTARRKAEDKAWAEAQRKNSRASFDGYIKDYPKGRYVTAARAALKRLSRSAAAPAAPLQQPGANSQSAEAPPRIESWPYTDDPFGGVSPFGE